MPRDVGGPSNLTEQPVHVDTQPLEAPERLVGSGAPGSAAASEPAAVSDVSVTSTQAAGSDGLTVEPTRLTRDDTEYPSSVIAPAAGMEAVSAAATVGTPPVAPPEPDLGDGTEGRVERVWSNRWARLAVIGLAVILVALLVLWGVNHSHKSDNPPASTSTSVTSHAATTSTSSTTSTTVASLLPAAQQTQYSQYVSTFDAAAGTANAGIAGLGTSPTLTQAAPIVAAYLAAVKLYNLQVHYVQWPASMQADVQANDNQLATYIAFLQTAGTADPNNNPSAWLSQLRQQTASMQTADNKVRHDAALPAASAPL